MNSPRKDFDVVWYAPWFGDLVSNYLDCLHEAGYSCFLITTNKHRDNSQAKFSPNFRFISQGSTFNKLKRYNGFYHYLRNINSKILLIDVESRLFSLLFFLLLSFSKNLIISMHEVPHGGKRNIRDTAIRILQNLLIKRSRGILTFSLLSSNLAKLHYPKSNVFVVPLLPESRTFKNFIFCNNRSNFAMIGSFAGYKGFEIGLNLWGEYIKLNKTTEVLDLWLSGVENFKTEVPNVRIRSLKSYRADELENELPHYRAVFLPYKSSSQSGVQILAQAAGVACIVSDIQGLAQNQPSSPPVLNILDVSKWCHTIGVLSEGTHASQIGQLSKDFFYSRSDSKSIFEIFQVIIGEVRQC